MSYQRRYLAATHLRNRNWLLACRLPFLADLYVWTINKAVGVCFDRDMSLCDPISASVEH